jgi:hypothetical protein
MQLILQNISHFGDDIVKYMTEEELREALRMVESSKQNLQSDPTKVNQQLKAIANALFGIAGVVEVPK